MDTGKLLQVIQDTQEEEAIASTQAILNNINSYYAQNTVAASENISEEKQKLRIALAESSPISKYAISDHSALEQLGISTLFGPGLYQRLEDILSAPNYEVVGRLQSMLSERDLAIANLAAIQAGMQSFDMKSRTLSGNNYEIGFTLPDSYADLSKAESALKDLRLILESLADATNSQQPLRIKYVSNGTIEYFIHASVELAQNFDILLDYAIKIYTLIKICEDGKKLHDKMKESRKKKVIDLLNEQKEDDTDKLLVEMVKKLDIPTEKKAEVTGRFKCFLKHIEAGVGAEVRTPRVASPQEPGEDATKEQTSAYKQELVNFDSKTEIDERNQKILSLQQNKLYGVDTRFLDTPTEDLSK